MQAETPKIGDRVIWRGAVYTVLALDEWFGAPWVRIRTGGFSSRWVPVKHVKHMGAREVSNLSPTS